MPRKRVEGSENKSTKTTTAKRGTVKSAETKTKETQAKVTEDTQRLEDIGEPVIEETLTETDEENNSVEVKITTDEEAGSDVVVEENQPWSEEDKRALDAFQSLPQANQKLYDKLMQDALRPEKYVSSGSFILDAVLSNGDGIPMGTFIEVTAPAYTGKSSMLLFVAKNLCKQGYRCAYIDSERGLNQKQVDSFGLTRYVTNKMFLPITTYDTFEKVDDFLVETLNDPSLNFIFIDSLTAVSPQSMIDKTASESQTMAIHARYTSNFLRRFRSLFTGTDKTIFFIAQNRKQFTQYGAQDSAAEELRMNEIAVFKEMINAGAPMIMVGHIAAPSLTGDKTPCSLSSVVVTDILRNELGFQGVIISDALNKKAISEYYDSGEACVRAIKSGCDMLLEPEDFLKGYAAVLDAVVNGTIAEERINDSLRRIYRIKYADKLEQ